MGAKAREMPQPLSSKELTLVMTTIPVAALVTALIAARQACSVHAACSSAINGSNVSCINLGDRHTCSFVAILRKRPDKDVANGSSAVANACLPGMRALENDGSRRCVLQMAWSNAMIVDAMDPFASRSSKRACGRWMDAFAGPPNVPFAFQDLAQASADLWSLASVVSSSEASVSRFAPRRSTKLMTMCSTALSNGKMGIVASMRQAFDALYASMRNDVDSVERVLFHLGDLAARRCPGPARIRLETNANGFFATLTDGKIPSKEHVLRALRGMHIGETASVESAQAIEALRITSACPIREVSEVHVAAVLKGASGQSVTPRWPTDRTSLQGLHGALCLMGVLEGPLNAYAQERALAMLRALLGECIAVVGDRMRGSDGRDSLETSMDFGKKAHSYLDESGSLGRFLPEGDQTLTMNKNTMSVSTGVLSRANVLMTHAADSTVLCSALVRYAAVSLAEEWLFSVLVPESLYTRLEKLSERMQAAVVHVVSNETPITAAFASAETMRSGIYRTRVRISGAYDETWAGRTESRPQTTIDASQGIISALLEHIRGETRGWMDIVLDQRYASSDSRPFVEATHPSAYYSHLHRSIFVMLGLLHAPVADEAFDDASLASRIGFVLAHEFAHAGYHATSVRSEAYDALLKHYDPSTREEALADVIALRAIRHAVPSASCETLLLHMAQLFCRSEKASNGEHDEFATDQHASGGAYPPGNARIDLLSRTMYTEFSDPCGGWE